MHNIIKYLVCNTSSIYVPEFYLIESIKHQEEYPLLPNTQIFKKNTNDRYCTTGRDISTTLINSQNDITTIETMLDNLEPIQTSLPYTFKYKIPNNVNNPNTLPKPLYNISGEILKWNGNSLNYLNDFSYTIVEKKNKLPLHSIEYNMTIDNSNLSDYFTLPKKYNNIEQYHSQYLQTTTYFYQLIQSLEDKLDINNDFININITNSHIYYYDFSGQNTTYVGGDMNKKVDKNIAAAIASSTNVLPTENKDISIDDAPIEDTPTEISSHPVIKNKQQDLASSVAIAAIKSKPLHSESSVSYLTPPDSSIPESPLPVIIPETISPTIHTPVPSSLGTTYDICNNYLMDEFDNSNEEEIPDSNLSGPLSSPESTLIPNTILEPTPPAPALTPHTPPAPALTPHTPPAPAPAPHTPPAPAPAPHAPPAPAPAPHALASALGSTLAPAPPAPTPTPAPAAPTPTPAPPAPTPTPAPPAPTPTPGSTPLPPAPTPTPDSTPLPPTPSPPTPDSTPVPNSPNVVPTGTYPAMPQTTPASGSISGTATLSQNNTTTRTLRLHKLDGIYKCKASSIPNYIEIYKEEINQSSVLTTPPRIIRVQNFLYEKHRIESKLNSQKNARITIIVDNEILDNDNEIFKNKKYPILLASYTANLYAVILFFKLIKNNLTIPKLYNNIKTNNLFDKQINLDLMFNKISNKIPYINSSNILFPRLIDYCDNPSDWRDIMLTNSTLTHLIVNRTHLQYLDYNGLTAKYNLFNNIANSKKFIKEKTIYDISSNYYTLKYTESIKELNILFKKRYDKIYNYLDLINTSFPNILTNEYKIMKNMSLNNDIVQYPDMFNLEIMNTYSPDNKCIFTTGWENYIKARNEKINLLKNSSNLSSSIKKKTKRVINNAFNKMFKTSSGGTVNDSQCKILWTDLIFIYNNKNIRMKGGRKKHKHNKLFNKYYRKIKNDKNKTNKLKTSKQKTLKIIY